MEKRDLSNEDFIEVFRDWRLLWKPTDSEINEETDYLRKLADFASPVPLLRITKALAQDFHLEEQTKAYRAGNPRARFGSMVRLQILLDAFKSDLRAGRI